MKWYHNFYIVESLVILTACVVIYGIRYGY